MNNNTTVRSLSALLRLVKDKTSPVHIGYDDKRGKLISKPFKHFSDEEGGAWNCQPPQLPSFFSLGCREDEGCKVVVMVGADDPTDNSSQLYNVYDLLDEFERWEWNGEEDYYLVTNVDDDYCHVNNQILQVAEFEGLVVIY